MQVCSQAGATGLGAALLCDLGEGADVELERALSELARNSNTTISTSLLRGLRVLAALPGGGDSIGVVGLSAVLDMTPSTVYRYLTTLVLAGLAQRHETTRAYSRIAASRPTALAER